MIRALLQSAPVLGVGPTTRRPEPVMPADLRPGDWLRDHGMFRTVARVETPAFLADTLIVVFEPDERGDTLGVKAQQSIVAWREATG